MITENLSTLKIHKLTQAQYDRELAAGNIDENALYLTPDEEIDLSPYATIEQLNTKADTSHSHGISDVDNLQITLDTKADTNHTHNYAGKGVEGEVFTVDGIEVTAQTGAEVFNDYTNIATGNNSHAEGIYAKALGDYSHAEGGGTTASGSNSHTEGAYTVASGARSHAEGDSTTASGANSHAEGAYTMASGNCSHAEGSDNVASGDCSHAEGIGTTASGSYSHAAGYYTTADNYQYVVGKYNSPRTAPTVEGQDTTYEDGIFIVGNGTAHDESSRSNALRVSSGGRCYSGRFVAGTADFAELFEWSDGNPKGEDRRGLFVALDGEKIKLADVDDDYFGVVSGTPAFIGNSASEEWHDKYLTDVFGTRLSQEVEIPEKIDSETGEILVPSHTVTQFIINPKYNPNETYVMRENRKEWDTVGLCGQVVVVDDGTCIAGGYCKPSHDGIGTIADNGYRVMKRIDETHIKVLVK